MENARWKVLAGPTIKGDYMPKLAIDDRVGVIWLER
jgi:hypothetical protein